MGFLDKLKELFKKKYSPVKTVNSAPSEKEEEKPNEQIEKEEIKNENLEESPPVQKEVQQNLNFAETANRTELLEIIDSVRINKEDLALDKIQTEAETISSYVKGLIKDLATYQDFKEDKQKIEETLSAIGRKIKLITQHGLELKNLLANLEDHYYNPLIEVLRKVNKKAGKEEIEKLINDLEKDLGLIRTLDSQTTKVIGYNELFNPDKNITYKEEIEKEAKRRIIHGELNDLLNKILLVVIDRSISAKSKIEKVDYIEAVKALL